MTDHQRAATYCRISRDDDLTEDGVTRQAEDTEALALSRGIPIQGRYQDNDISATTGKKLRPDYELLMSAVRSGEVNVIVVRELTRLWRNRRERMEGIELFSAHKVRILAVRGPELDFSHAVGRMLADVLGGMATFETDVMSERTVREIRQRAERGHPPTGHRTFGYDASGWEIVPSEAAEVRAAFDALLSGASLSGIAAGLNSRGVLNRNGRPWTHNSMRVLLMNKRYAALRDLRGQEYPGAWPAIVSEDTVRAARHVLTEPDRRSSPGPARVRLLSGLARCGVCDDGTTVTAGSKGRGQATYRCRLHLHLNRSVEAIDLTVEEYVIGRLSRPDAAALFHDEQAEGAEELRAQAVTLRGRLKALAAEFADDDEGDVTEFRTAVHRLRGRLADVESRMAHPQRARVLSGLVDAADVRAAWGMLSLDRRRSVVELLVEVTILSGGTGGRRPFDPASVRIVPRA
ncbi:recombinase family protein [Streptomyces sp. NBC_00090]|uniref:recombinase family protein n=1 Tax=Streptomyces sp. NBC_00090 TaxID=2903619 RepID=UPI0032518727